MTEQPDFRALLPPLRGNRAPWRGKRNLGAGTAGTSELTISGWDVNVTRFLFSMRALSLASLRPVNRPRVI